MIFLRILGLLWILIGVWWVLRPKVAKKRMKSHFRRNLTMVLLGVFFSIAGLLFAVGRRLDNALGWILPVIAAIFLIVGLLTVRGRVSAAVFAWWEVQPTWVYRMAGGAMALVGIAFWLL